MIHLTKKQRFNYFEKKQTSKELKAGFKQENYTYTVEKFKFLKFFTKEFYFVGNIRNVKTVFLVAYNTKNGYFWPTKKQYPFNVLKEKRMNIMGRFIPVILIFFTLSILFMLLAITFNINQLIFTISQYLLMLFVMPMFFLGVASKHNVAANDAAIEYALKKLDTMSKAERNHIGFIFCDTTTRITLMRAITAFFKKVNKNPQIVELDNIGAEGEIGVASVQGQVKLASTLTKKYKIKHFLLPNLEENKVYNRYLIIATGMLDKDKDLFNKYTLKKKDDIIHSNFEKVENVLDYFYEE